MASSRTKSRIHRCCSPGESPRRGARRRALDWGSGPRQGGRAPRQIVLIRAGIAGSARAGLPHPVASALQREKTRKMSDVLGRPNGERRRPHGCPRRRSSSREHLSGTCRWAHRGLHQFNDATGDDSHTRSKQPRVAREVDALSRNYILPNLVEAGRCIQEAGHPERLEILTASLWHLRLAN